MYKSHILGYPRIGPNRELKFAIEKFLENESIEKEKNILNVKEDICNLNWKNQINLGLDYINIGDFSYYDHILNNLIYLGCPPSRFNINLKKISIKDYFKMTKGDTDNNPMELTKWFNTNYHYLVPEYNIKTNFSTKNNWLIDDIKKAKLLNYPLKVLLIGPLSILKLGKIKDNKLKNRLLLLPNLLLNYIKFINKINSLKINFIQIEEPCLVLNLNKNWIKSFKAIYFLISKYFSNLILTTYFGEITNYINFIFSLNNIGLHLDINIKEIDFLFEKKYINNKNLISLGIIDGRNIWRNNLEKSFYLINKISNIFKNISLSTNTSLLHVPINLEKENINKNIKSWLCFSIEKIKELNLLKTLLNFGYNDIIPKEFIKNIYFIYNKKTSNLKSNKKIQNIIKNLKKEDFKTRLKYKFRKIYQKIYLNINKIPTTTIGSFPQTKKIRNLRLNLKKKYISKKIYELSIKKEIKFCIKKQLNYKLDVLSHGEFERNDMVEYFAESLNGFIVTNFGWVQSFGTRCVKPSIIYGDIYMPKYITVKWIKYSQSLTKKYVKGMITGPVTILKWSFCRNDQPLYITALQISLALNKEIMKLEENNIRIIQIDEPGLRELLPIDVKNYNKYYNWSTKSFILSNKGINKITQIHSHICYSEFKTILPFLKKIDTDVISIECARSNMQILSFLPKYINEIGVGIYDIHSKKKINLNNTIFLVKIIINNINKNSLWINPDCGLKTRKWEELDISLRNMVNSVKILKKTLNL